MEFRDYAYEIYTSIRYGWVCLFSNGRYIWMEKALTFKECDIFEDRDTGFHEIKDEKYRMNLLHIIES